MKAYIYKKILIPTGKFYIGKHNGNNKYYLGSGTDWIMDIKKHTDNPSKDIITEILEYVDDISELNKREIYWLEYYDAANNPLFYNKTNKSSGISTELSRKLLSEKIKNHPSIINNPDRNKKISETLMNNKERGKKISETLKNKPKSDIHKKNMSKPKPPGFNDKLKKEIIQMDDKENIIKIYSSLTEASKETGFNIQAINNCVLGKSKSSFGYLWKYK